MKIIPYIGPLDYRDLSQGKQILWLRLLAPFRYGSAVLNDESVLESGFECDGESIPNQGSSIVPPYGAARPGAVAHDGLYKFAGYFRPDGTFVPVDRATADLVYRELLILNGIPKWRAYHRWAMLKVFGGKAWNEHRQRENPKIKPTSPAGRVARQPISRR